MNGNKPLIALLIALLLAGVGWFVHDVYREIDNHVKELHKK